LQPCVLEKKLNLHTEVSVVMARSNDDKKVFYPLIENKHVNGILDNSTIPANIDKNYQSVLEISQIDYPLP